MSQSCACSLFLAKTNEKDACFRVPQSSSLPQSCAKEKSSGFEIGFPWATGNSTFRHCMQRVIRSNSYCFFCHRDNNRSRFEKVPHLDYSLKKFCIFFDRYAKKWLQERQKCEDLSADRSLSAEYALFLRLRWGGWNFLFGLLGLVLPQIPAKKRHVFTSVRVPSSS